MGNAPAVEPVMTVLGRLVDREYPGSRIGCELLGDPGASSGFGVSHHGGLTLVHADVTTAGPGWWLRMDSCIAADVPDIDRCLDWANAGNRSTGLGRYYCVLSRDLGLASVVFETTLWGEVLAMALGGAGGPARAALANWVMDCVRANVVTGLAQGGDLLEQCGGRRLVANAGGLAALLTMVRGPH